MTLDDKGSASYEIMQPRAWDKIEITDVAIEITKADIFIYGSLVCREQHLRHYMNY
jgi:fructokinase